MRKLKINYFRNCRGGGMLIALILVVGAGFSAAQGLPFEETFEAIPSMAGTLGTVDGQNGWSASSAGAVVQSGTVYGGAQALQLQDVSTERAFSGPHTNVVISFDVRPLGGESAPNSSDISSSPVVFWINSNAQVEAYDGTSIVTNTSNPVSIGSWQKMSIEVNYAAKTWSLVNNGTRLFSDIGFYYTGASSLTGFRITESSAGAFSYFDNLVITNVPPPAGLVVSASALNIGEGATATFDVSLSANPGNTVTVSVARVSGDVDITVQSGATLAFNSSNWSTLQPVTLIAAQDADDQNGSAVIRCSSSGMTSEDVAATEVDNDEFIPPTITSVRALSAYTVEIQFDEAVEQVTAENSANYSIDLGITVLDVVRDTADSSVVRLHVSDLAETLYTINVSSVEDLFGNSMLPDSKTFQYSVGLAIFFSELMDSDPGWTTSGEWEFGVPAWQNESPGGSYGATSAFSGVNVYAYDLTGDYSKKLTSGFYLTTPAIDCSGFTNVFLSFQRWLGVENQPWDGATLEVSTNGTLWELVWQNNSLLDESTWSQQEYDLTATASNQPTVYLRWGIGATDGSGQYSGWALDDVMLLGFSDSGSGSAPDADSDADGIPAWWEELYYGGPTNANAGALAANGINTLLEAYIAGIDPMDPTQTFRLSNSLSQSSEYILEWDAVSGRTYSVYWSSNLVSGFVVPPLGTGIMTGFFTDAVHNVEDEGFYYIDVQLSE